MENNYQSDVLVVTDKVGGVPTNGSQVMARAVLTELSRWFNLTIIVQKDEKSPEGLVGEIIEIDLADENLNEIAESLIANHTSLIYNFGCTTFSSEVTAILHSINPEKPIINHFQLVLPEYARYEGYNSEEVNELSYYSTLVTEKAKYNIFPSFSELNRVIRLGWQIQNSNNCVIKNAFVPAPGLNTGLPLKASINFMAAGRFSDYVKGADMLYRAFSEYYKEDPSAHLYIASDEQRFIKLLSGIPESAWTYLGWLSRHELHRRLSEVDVVIVPSRYEPFGLIAIEAMAMGTPVIAMAIGGLMEIIHHEYTGWLCDPQEGSLGLKRAMKNAAGKKEKLSSMGETSRSIVKTEFSLEKMVGDIKKILDNTFSIAMAQ